MVFLCNKMGFMWYLGVNYRVIDIKYWIGSPGCAALHPRLLRRGLAMTAFFKTPKKSPTETARLFI